jgi:hypothetical protein
MKIQVFLDVTHSLDCLSLKMRALNPSKHWKHIYQSVRSYVFNGTIASAPSLTVTVKYERCIKEFNSTVGSVICERFFRRDLRSLF